MGEQCKQCQTLFWGGSKITADGDFSHEIKTLTPWKESYDQLSILKDRDITLSTKVCLVNATVFPVVMYGCESWTIKKAEHRRIGAFELWCWESLEIPFKVPWTARRSSQSILRDTDVQNSPLDSVGEGEGGMIWENGIETCVISYMKQVTSPGSMHDTGCLGLVHGTAQRDGMGREEGGGFRMGNTCIPVLDSF